MTPKKLLNTIPKSDTDPNHLSPLNLAYLGDAIYSLLTRTKLVTQANRPTRALNKIANHAVSAPCQAANYHKLQPHLTEEEISILKRGRNANPGQKAKNASFTDYRSATGLEALFGYLYLQGSNDRLLELFELCWTWSESNEKS